MDEVQSKLDELKTQMPDEVYRQLCAVTKRACDADETDAEAGFNGGRVWGQTRRVRAVLPERVQHALRQRQLEDALAEVLRTHRRPVRMDLWHTRARRDARIDRRA